jgi:hypothetical protein
MKEKAIAGKGEPFFCLEASGSDREIGKQIGAATAVDISEAWECWMIPHIIDWFGTPVEKYAETYGWLRRNLEKVSASMAEQIDGIAEGSGFDVEKVWMMNHYGLLWAAHGLFCTSVALRDSDQGPVLGQNLDIGPEDFYFVTKLTFQGGTTILSDAMCAMCWSPTGINDKGLVVGSSNLPSQARRTEKPLAEGVPNHYIPRMTLRACGTTEEAVDFITSLPPVCPATGGYQMNIIDARGEMAVVDKTGPHCVVRQCEKDMNFTSNFSLNEGLEKWRTEGADPGASYDCRMRGRNIQAAYEKLNARVPPVQWLEELFRSHDERGPLCGHGDEASAERYSRLHFIYYPRQRRMRLTNGPPCMNEYRIFSI